MLETLLKNYKLERWRPVSIETVRKSIAFSSKYSVISDIAYNLQYLQYIDKQLKELQLTTVLKKMLYKNYVITGISIVESIFYNLLKSKNRIPIDCWRTKSTYISNEIGNDDNRTRTVVDLQEKVESYEKNVSFEFLISKIKKEKILKNDSGFYTLDLLRTKRNKIHINKSIGPNDTDYNKFNNLDYLFLRAYLSIILGDNAITYDDKRGYLEVVFKNALQDFLNEFNN